MSGSVNKVILVGNVGAKPEIRNTQSGDKVASFSVATSDSWKDQNGERQTRTEWHRVVVFGGLTKIIESYIDKGSKLYLEGQLRTRKWQNNQGQDVYTTEVVLTNFEGSLTMLDSAGGRQSVGGGYDNSQSQAQSGGTSFASNNQTSDNAFSSAGSADNNAISDLDDEIPF
ncbi:MAG: single-stranded DNA-binding protein [Alphaproteobacteria bacterium]